MFDIGALELLIVVIVAIIVIGPKDMPAALRVAGRWVGKLRQASAQFRSGFDSLVREAEMEDMEKKWKEQNERIMAETPAGEMGPLADSEADAGRGYPDDLIDQVGEGEQASQPADTVKDVSPPNEPMLPLDPTKHDNP